MELERIVKDIGFEAGQLTGAHDLLVSTLDGAPVPLDKPRILACLTVMELRLHTLRSLVSSCPS